MIQPIIRSKVWWWRPSRGRKIMCQYSRWADPTWILQKTKTAVFFPSIFELIILMFMKNKIKSLISLVYVRRFLFLSILSFFEKVWTEWLSYVDLNFMKISKNQKRMQLNEVAIAIFVFKELGWIINEKTFSVPSTFIVIYWETNWLL